VADEADLSSESPEVALTDTILENETGSTCNGSCGGGCGGGNVNSLDNNSTGASCH